MKVHLITTALLCLATTAFAQFGVWTPVDRIDISATYHEVVEAGANQFITVGEIGGDAISIARRSVDNGITWDTLLYDSTIRRNLQVIHRARKYNAISVPELNAYYVASDSGEVFRTWDGGDSWDTLKTGADLQLLSIDMIDRLNGLVEVEHRSLMYTEDGGDSWHNVSLPADLLPLGIFSVDYHADGQITLLGALTNGSKLIAKTSNFGDSWNRHEFDVCLSENMHFVNSSDGWAAWREPTGTGDIAFDVIRRTTNGGATWAIQLRELLGDSPFGLYNCNFIDKDFGIAYGFAGKLLHTTNGGLDWTQLPTGLNEFDEGLASIWSIAYPNRDVAVAVSRNGWILRYDANATSVSDASHTKQALSRVYPNPVGAAAVLVLSDYHSGGVDLINAQGMLVKKIEVEPWDVDSETGAMTLQVDTPELPAGVYFAGYTTQDGRLRFVKFVVGL